MSVLSELTDNSFCIDFTETYFNAKTHCNTSWIEATHMLISPQNAIKFNVST